MAAQKNLGGSFTFPNTKLTVNRIGYGAMQLAGPHVFGPPKDRAGCIAVLREAIASGVDHIDTSDFYGPHITNQIIKEAIHPYPRNLVIVTKVGATRGPDGSWIQSTAPQLIIDAIHDNLRNLGLDVIDIVNLRMTGLETPTQDSVEEGMTTLADLQQKGLIRHIGVSNVSPTQFKEARKFAPIVCVQNMYNVAKRADDTFIANLAAEDIAYVPFFPLGGFTPLQSSALDEVAASLNATPMQVAQAWLLQHSPNILLIPGTSSLTHLRENLAAATLQLPAESITTLNAIAQK
jgi:aryl-alcohol dehydrogenase-like predicted oxidoreductase